MTLPRRPVGHPEVGSTGTSQSVRPRLAAWRRPAVVALLSVSALAFNDGTGPHYADGYLSLVQGPGQGFGTVHNMFGPPEGLGPGAGGLDVYSLGVGGEVVLILEPRAFNGPGTDLVVYENPFVLDFTEWQVYAELLTVAVSSNGVDFARFPVDFEGEPGPYIQGSTQLPAPVTYFKGFAGVLPVSASPPGVTPFDIVAGGGDCFDLADLINHPEVIAGNVDLDDIRYVKLTDVVAGVDTDDQGDAIWDCGFPASSAADIDAVAALNSNITGDSFRPMVEFTLNPTSQLLSLVLEDFDGLSDIKNDLSASVNGVTVPFSDLLPFFVTLSISATRIEFVTGPVPPAFDRMLLKVSAKDGLGRIGGDAIFIP